MRFATPAFTRRSALLLAALLVTGCANVPRGDGREINVMTSGGFTAAYNELTPNFERQTGYKVKTAYGASMGAASDSIPSRLSRGEPVDVVILARPALDALVAQGKVVPGSQVDLVKSRRILSERVGTIVARGEAALGLQQVSELLPIEGIDYIGPLPAEVQRVTVFSAGVSTTSRAPDAAKQLIHYFTSAPARPAIERSGLEPVATR